MFELQNQKEPHFSWRFSHRQASRRLQGYFMNQMQNTEIALSPTEMLSSLKDVLRSNIIQLFIVVIL